MLATLTRDLRDSYSVLHAEGELGDHITGCGAAYGGS